MKKVWDGMKTITGCRSKRDAPIEGEVGRANQLNNFFKRFDHPVPFTPRKAATLIPTLPKAISDGTRWEESSPKRKKGVNDAIIFLFQLSLSHLDRGSGTMRITFLDFSSAFNC